MHRIDCSLLASSDGVARLGKAASGLPDRGAGPPDSAERLTIFTTCEFEYGYLSLEAVAFLLRATYSAKSTAAMCQARGWRTF